MSVLVAIARLVLAGVFIVSALAKVRDRAGSREAVRAFGVPLPLVGAVAGGLPVAEVMCAALLVTVDPLATIGAVASLVLLAVFTIAIIANLVNGRRPECRCFGSMGGSGGIGWSSVARNAALLGLAGISLVGTGELRAVPSVVADLDGPELGLLVAVAAVGALLVGMALALRTLMARYGGVLLRLEALEQATGTAPAPLAADFALPDLDGELVSLDDALAGGRPVLLVFISPSCHNCADLLPDLSDWQSDVDHPLSVVVVSEGSVAENRAKLADIGPLRVLLQDGYATSDSYGIQGTPGAALVGAEGRRAGAPVHAVGGIRSLHETLVRAMAGVPANDPHVHTIGPRPVVPGDPLPDVELRTTEPEAGIPVVEAFEDGAVVLFWRSDCGYCARILADVRALEAEVAVRIVTGTDLPLVRDSGLVSPVLRDPDGALESWLRVPGTPSAVRVRDGVVDSDLAVGGPDVLALLRASARSAVAVD